VGLHDPGAVPASREPQLGVGFHHPGRRRAPRLEPPIDVQDLGSQGERLAGEAFPGQPPVLGRGGLIAGRLHRGADRRDEQRWPPAAERLPGQLVRPAPPGIGQADGNVDRDHQHRAVRGGLASQFRYPLREISPRPPAGEGDCDPAGPAGVNTQHPFAAHPAMLPLAALRPGLVPSSRSSTGAVGQGLTANKGTDRSAQIPAPRDPG
jgi:hypothetical protein